MEVRAVCVNEILSLIKAQLTTESGQLPIRQQGTNELPACVPSLAIGSLLLP